MNDNSSCIWTKLNELYPEARCELVFSTPFELLIATILSAQCTDERVNKVTPALFAKYPHPRDYTLVPPHVLEEEIRSCGLFRSKARNIIACCRELMDRFTGEVPNTIEELESLPGVGRKTANVVASNAFGIPAIAVDTHVFRVARRLGLATGSTTLAVEAELCQAFPQEYWSHMHHLLIWHGRRVCDARKPRCGECTVQGCCHYYPTMQLK
jgi:endonuclease-3